MSADRYQCCDEGRRAQLVAAGAPPNVSGIDFIEVHAGATTADPTTIDIVLVKALPLPLAALTGANISITGGVRFPRRRSTRPSSRNQAAPRSAPCGDRARQPADGLLHLPARDRLRSGQHRSAGVHRRAHVGCRLLVQG